ncbi:MG2 domain protein [Pseudobythopirellula maris]|uniref:MG2 domain protein n=1 Tax=Pseudobythopirellula maris TaxID=2527991 RepID=A0A5C5ZMG5_9BACT|nr:MG2 domain-containing protein [Pseudobythopirellula maris]TWT88286.1 MG2 domain protein [Pseudobythopirellula maris]
MRLNSTPVGRCSLCAAGRKTILLASALLAVFACAHEALAQPSRDKVEATMTEGNWAEAAAMLDERLATDDATPADLADRVTCLQRLNQISEADALLERVAERHGEDAAMLFALAQQYSRLPNSGHEIDGESVRGSDGRTRGPSINFVERDRVRRLQLLRTAAEQLDPERQPDQALARRVWRDTADAIAQNRTSRYSWRLLAITDLTELPEPSEGWPSYGGSDPPVDADNPDTPIFHELPESWQAATTDGERWRWALSRSGVGQTRYADFLREQFSVRSLLSHGWAFTPDDDADAEAAKWDLATLGEDETIARLATGVKRFKLPRGHNHLAAYRELGRWEQLAAIYLDRRQRGKAAGCLRKAIEKASSQPKPNQNHLKNLKSRLAQVVEPWGAFDGVTTQPAGAGATLQFRSRNATRVDFSAHKIDARRLLGDVKGYLESGPRELDHQQLQVEQLGWRLIQEGQDKYVGEETARWSLDVAAAPDHGDKEIDVTTPLQEAGGYLVTARVAGDDGKAGNEVRVVVWVADTAIVVKPMAGKRLTSVVDARTGAPIASANVEQFGFRIDNNRRAGGPLPRQFKVLTERLTEKTDADGLLVSAVKKQAIDPEYQWLTTATTEDGRFAYLGFDGVWRGTPPGDRPQNVQTFMVTDRPVYRPEQTVHFKAWVAKPRYGVAVEDETPSPFAHKAFQVKLHNPKGEVAEEFALTSNVYGGLEGEYALPAGATLGRWRLEVVGHGGESFLVEEYKKPEFEVTVEAPEDPVALGEEFNAIVKAKYYFGEPVTGATVSYKVLRSERRETWTPPRPWDWLYGEGYGWLGQDATWRSDWRRWGCFAPRPSWFPWPSSPPEVVLEGEAPIGPGGTLLLPIDTELVKELYGSTDHRYEVTAEVTDESRRTIVGKGSVLVARRPFNVTVWLDRGYYQVSDTMTASVAVRRADGKPLSGKGEMRLLKLAPPAPFADPDRPAEPSETVVQAWDLVAGPEGRAELKIKASEAGRYRLAYALTDERGRKQEGGVIFTILGPGFDGGEFLYNELELVLDKPEHQPGDTLRLQVNTNRVGSSVLLFVRPEGRVYPAPQRLQLAGKSQIVDLEIDAADSPNFFVEAVTVSGGKVHTVVRQIAVPPVSRVLKVEALPSATAYQPGQKGTIRLRVTDQSGAPVAGEAVVAVYDKSVEYIAGGPSGGDIRERFWSWRRSHHPHDQNSLQRSESPVTKPGETAMQPLGAFGGDVNIIYPDSDVFIQLSRRREKYVTHAAPAPMMARGMAQKSDEVNFDMTESGVDLFVTLPEGVGAAPTLRSEFADTALWAGAVTVGADGLAELPLAMPDNLTAWRIRVWCMSTGVRVGEATGEVVTRKNLLIRPQAPRFLVDTDEAVLSANVHNYLGEAREVKVVLELGGDALESSDELHRTITVEPGDDVRVDWRVRAVRDGEASLKITAVSGADSDAVLTKLPVVVHGAERVDSFSGVLASSDRIGSFEIKVPEKRRVDDTRLVVRWSPSLAGAMVDALPYLVDYPHGCTEQTLNRFLPAAVTQQTLMRMGIDLAAVRDKRTNLNAQQIGDAAERAARWKRYDRNPVFDDAELGKIVGAGVERLTAMQLTDGGWGWFSGYGERSSAHTTAVVVRGLLVARDNDVKVDAEVLERGLAWLSTHQAKQLAMLRNTKEDGSLIDDKKPWKRHADNLDALVHLVMVRAGTPDGEMRGRLFDERLRLAPYAQAMLGVALHDESLAKNAEEGLVDLRDRVIRNLKQFVVEDAENQTAYLNLPGGYWWRWYGSEYEAHAYFLKLLSATEPESNLTSGLVKYLLNNRKHGARWSSTRDTALVVEAMADYLLASGEGRPEQTVEVWVDGAKRKEVAITPENLFSFDGSFTLEGADLTAGRHTVELRKRGSGKLYYNAYLTNFTMEERIRSAGLELRVDRKLYKLTPVEAKQDARGALGQVVSQRAEKFDRKELDDLAQVESGDLVEVELTVESKNDYEYLLFADHKPAGFEPVEVRSGYNGNALGAYVEYRDRQVNLFVSRLPRGEHTVRYRLRAETPGRFSALPTQAAALYAPELRGNSDELRVRVTD